MNSIKFITQQSVVKHLRRFHQCVIVRTAQAEVVPEVEKLTIPVPEGVAKPVHPKIEKLVTEISSLNLIEVSELSDLLKKRLNLPDAPVMPMGGFMAASPEKEEEEVQEPKKTLFKVKLVKYEDKQKVALIKEIKSIIPDINLVQAKKFVESVPVFVKSDLIKDEAEALKESLVKLGAVVEIE